MKRFAAAILIKDDKILLGKRSRNRELYPNVWDVIGGHCEENESFEAAMLRELKEEIGVIPIEYLPFIFIEKPPLFILQIFTVNCWSGEVENLQTDENEQIGWFSIDEALNLHFPDEEYRNILHLLKT